MKASEFINLMRKVIREEVRTVIREELKSLKPLLMEKSSPKRVGIADHISQPARIPQVKIKQAERTIQEPRFTGPLADLLNETYESMIARPQEEDEWPDMNNGPMDSQMFAGMEGSTMGLNSMLADESSLPASRGYSDPTNAFVKDYSAIMKSADAIQGKL